MKNSQFNLKPAELEVTATLLVAAVLFGVLIAFVVWAFRQGFKVKPHDNPDNFPPGTGA